MESFQGGGEKDVQETPQLSPAQTKERFDFWLSTLRAKGYTGSNDVSEARKWQAKNDPNTVVGYYTKDGQPLNAKHIDMVKEQYKDVFKKLGIDPSRPSATLTNSEKLSIQKELGPKITPEFLIQGHDDGLTDWRAPLSPMDVPLKPITDVNFGKISTAAQLPAQNNPAPNNTFVPEDETPEEKVKREVGNNMLLLPSQNPMLPNSLGQSLKLTDRSYQLEKAHVSPEQAIQEGNRNQTALIEQINNMPGAQRAAVLAQMSGSQQEAINKAVFDANRYNAQVDATTSNQQAVLDNQSNRMNAQHALSYEQRTQRAQALTDNDLNNYYNTIRANEVRNKREVDQINYDNARNDNFQFDGEKFVQIADTEFGRGSEVYKTPEQRMLEQEELLKASKKLAKTKSRIANAKNGGRFKK